MAYQGNPPYQGGPGDPYQGGPGDPGGPYQGGAGDPYQGGPYQGGSGTPYQDAPGAAYPGGPGAYPGGPGAAYPGGPGTPYQGGQVGPYPGGPGTPYPGAPYQGTPGYAGVPTYQYSDWIHRVGAYLVDLVPVFVIYFIGALTGKTAIFLITLLIAIGYQVWNRWVLGGQGQSLGKRALGMRLVSEQTGQPIGTLNAFLRDICHFVDGVICYVGYLFPLWDAKRQTLADKIMHTVVVPA